VPNTRELVVTGTPYILPYPVAYPVAYTVVEEEVRIAAVLHGARPWPEDFEG
jgi:plasmid stabilization system protein ParE